MLNRFLSVIFVLVCATNVWAQAGLRQSLERLDIDENGEIDPEEITPLARPYLERIAEARRMDLNRSYSIERYQEAARIYHAFQNGLRGDRIRVESRSTVQGFEPDDEQTLIPDFGAAVIKYPYNMDDLEEADQTIRRYDRDNNGAIDRNEARRAVWTHNDPFDMDLNKDDQLNRIELAQRYARRRLVADDAGELIKKSQRTGNGIQPFERPRQEEERSRWWRDGGSSYWLTASLLGRFDANRNGRLENAEAQALGLPIGQIDINRDGELSRDELFGHLDKLQAEAGDATSPLPGWFYELDADRDGQVSMAEFTTEWTESKLQEFTSLDRNDDGLLTSDEVASAAAMVGGTFSNTVAEILPPRKSVISEIEVDEDIVIGDLNVQLSITHTSTSYLDAYLSGPDGERIELFAGVGGSGDNFDDTVFDDQASTPIIKGRPPYEGSFLTSAASRGQPSLGSFNGKNARGVWQLVIRGTRSERFGMLHSWSLRIKPDDQANDLASSEFQRAGAPETSLSSTDTGRQSSTDRFSADSSQPDSNSGGFTFSQREAKDLVLLERGDYKQIDWSSLEPEQVKRYKEIISNKNDGSKREEKREEKRLDNEKRDNSGKAYRRTQKEEK